MTSTPSNLLRTALSVTGLGTPLQKVLDRSPVIPSAVSYLAFKALHSDALSRHTRGDPDLVRRIRRDGFAVIPSWKTKEFCDRCVEAIEEILRDRPEYVQDDNDQRIFGAEELSDAFRPFHEDPWLQALSNHVSCVKTVNGFTLASKVSPQHWKMPHDGGWHRDMRFRQFKAFLYLDEVTPDNGPLQIVRASHRMPQHLFDVHAGALRFTSNSFSDEQIHRVVADDPSRLVTVTGGPGTLIVADLGTLHRGSPPRAGVRYALTNYYFEKDQVEPALRFKPANPDKLRRLREGW